MDRVYCVYYPANTFCSMDIDFSEQNNEQTSSSSPVTNAQNFPNVP